MGLFSKLFGGGGQGGSQSGRGEGTKAPPSPGTGSGDGAWDTLQNMQREPCPIRLIEEDEAGGEVAEIYEAIKRELQIPAVPNIDKALAHSPQALKATIGALQNLYGGSSLPQPVVSMMLYSIAVALDCQYCGSFHRLTCRTIGIDENMLAALGSNLGTVTPERVQAIIKFGTKAATAPKSLSKADFDALGELGISDAEIVEIIGLAALGRYLNIITDALKIEVDPMIKQGLAA